MIALGHSACGCASPAVQASPRCQIPRPLCPGPTATRRHLERAPLDDATTTTTDADGFYRTRTPPSSPRMLREPPPRRMDAISSGSLLSIRRSVNSPLGQDEVSHGFKCRLRAWGMRKTPLCRIFPKFFKWSVRANLTPIRRYGSNKRIPRSDYKPLARPKPVRRGRVQLGLEQ